MALEDLTKRVIGSLIVVHKGLSLELWKPVFVAVLVSLVMVQSSHAGQIPVLGRLVAKAKITEKDTPSAQLRAIREAALQQPVVSDPVSDRYLVTELGGPIDLVHFLGLAIQVFEGKNVDEALWNQYVEEGGLDFEKGRTDEVLVEAHPDDLPSNAFGALFGMELKSSGAIEVCSALTRFLADLKPLSDQVTKRYSHERIVMGLRPGQPLKVTSSRRKWFTARPLLVAGLVTKDPQEAAATTETDEALKSAGFILTTIRGRRIKIARVAR